MARYFAELKDNIVQRVIVADNQAWCEANLGGVWVETFMDTPGHNYAGIGYTYHADRTNFAAPQPYPSWLLNDACQWQAPIAQPDGMWVWDEATLSWLKPFNLTLDKATIIADGVDFATVTVRSAGDVAEIALDVRGETVTLPLVAGVGVLELTASAPTIAPHIVVKAVDQALFGTARITVEAI